MVADLGKLARELPGGGKARENFKAAFRACRGGQAELLDLQRCVATVTTLAELDRESREKESSETFVQDHWIALMSHAAYLSAIILYCRATERRSNHKPKPDYEASYTKEQRAEHEYLVRLRDDAMAHWGPGPDRFGVNHHDITVFMTDDGGVQTCFAGANYRADVLNSLLGLAKTALFVAEQKTQKAKSEVLQRYLELKAAEPGIVPPDLDEDFYLRGLSPTVEEEAPVNERTPGRVRS